MILTDKIIILIDGIAKGYFQAVMQEIAVLKHLAGINPCIDEDEVLNWLTHGA